MADDNKQIDDDILQCKADVFKASNMDSSPEKERVQKPNEQESEDIQEEQIVPPLGEKTTDSIKAVFDAPETKEPDLMEAVVKANKVSKIEQAKSPKSEPVISGNESRESEIPKFDLAEQIMARQRNISATKRLKPEKAVEAQPDEFHANTPENGVDELVTTEPEKCRIISEIVARDIEKLCRI